MRSFLVQLLYHPWQTIQILVLKVQRFVLLWLSLCELVWLVLTVLGITKVSQISFPSLLGILGSKAVGHTEKLDGDEWQQFLMIESNKLFWETISGVWILDMVVICVVICSNSTLWVYETISVNIHLMGDLQNLMHPIAQR